VHPGEQAGRAFAVTAKRSLEDVPITDRSQTIDAVVDAPLLDGSNFEAPVKRWRVLRNS
jgi:hypothetical protein